jgi:hypothetical protein
MSNAVENMPCDVVVVGQDMSVTRCVDSCDTLCAAAGSYEYIRRFIVEVSGAEKGHGPDAPSALPVYDLLAGSASGEVTAPSCEP